MFCCISSTQAKPQFHTGWFVESLATQTLVLFVIRTSEKSIAQPSQRSLDRNLPCDRGDGSLFAVQPVCGRSGIHALPAGYLAFVAGATGVYLLMVEAAKRRLLRPKRCLTLPSRTAQTIP